jgi:hypothetical protein
MGDLQEGSFAAWSRLHEYEQSVVFLPGEERAAVVTLSGSVELEGYEEDRVTDSFPVVLDDGGNWRVEAFAFGPGETSADFKVPGVADRGGLEDVRPATVLEVFAPAGEVLVRLDHLDSLARMAPDADRTVWSYLPPKALAAGTHDILVVTRGEDYFTATTGDFFVLESDPVACENIGFTPNSEYLASQIRAVATDCAAADKLVRHVHRELRHDFSTGPRSFTALGYDCTVRLAQSELPTGIYSCIDNGAARVTWDKT